MRKFTFHNVLDTKIAGVFAKEYSITLVARTGTMKVIEESSSFKLTLKNPCIDPDYVTIQKTALLVGL